MKGLAFVLGVIIDIACMVAAGVTNDMHLKATSESLVSVASVMTPLLVLWFLMGDPFDRD